MSQCKSVYMHAGITCVSGNRLAACGRGRAINTVHRAQRVQQRGELSVPADICHACGLHLTCKHSPLSMRITLSLAAEAYGRLLMGALAVQY